MERRSPGLRWMALAVVGLCTSAHAGSVELELKHGLREQPMGPAELKVLLESRRVRKPSAAHRLRFPYRAELRRGTSLREAPKGNARALHRWADRPVRVTVVADAGSWVYVKHGLRRGWVPEADLTPVRRGLGWRAWLERRKAIRLRKPVAARLAARAPLLRRPRLQGRLNVIAELPAGTAINVHGAVRRFVEVSTAAGRRGYLLRTQVQPLRPAPKPPARKAR